MDLDEACSIMDMTVGIDFGTANIFVAAITREDTVEVLPLGLQGHNSIASCVAYDDGAVSIGSFAKACLQQNMQNTLCAVKSIIGKEFEHPDVVQYRRTWPVDMIDSSDGPFFLVGDSDTTRQQVSPAKIFEMIIVWLIERTRDYCGRPIAGAAITVPVLFTKTQRDAIWNAGLKSGLQYVHLLKDPVAVAMGYEVSGTEHSVFLVMDFGTKSLTTSIVHCDGQSQFTVLTTHEDTAVGGDAFDDRLFQYFLQSLHPWIAADLVKNVLLSAQLREQCQQAKECLCRTSDDRAYARVFVPDMLPGVDLDVEIRKTDYVDVIDDLLLRITDPVGRVLCQAQMDVDKLAFVLVVGKAARLPKVLPILQDFFRRVEVKFHTNREEVAVSGAALYAQCIRRWYLGLEAEGAYRRQLDTAVDITSLDDYCQHCRGINTFLDPAATVVLSSETVGSFCKNPIQDGSEPVLGIDFGTSSLSWAVWTHHKVQSIHCTETFMPAYLVHTGDKWLCGKSGKTNSVEYVATTLLEMRRFFRMTEQEADSYCRTAQCKLPFAIHKGSVTENMYFRFPHSRGMKQYVSYVLAATELLKAVKQQAEQAVNGMIIKCAVNLPSTASEADLLDMSIINMALDAAGLKAVVYVREDSAILAGCVEHVLTSRSIALSARYFVVADVGAAETAVSVFSRESPAEPLHREFQEVSRFAGNWFDQLLVQHCVMEFYHQHRRNPSMSYDAMHRLRLICEEAKKRLAVGRDFDIHLEKLFLDKDLQVRLTASHFERLCSPVITRIVAVIDAALTGSGLTRDQPNTHLVLVGGGSQLPQVRHAIQQAFPIIFDERVTGGMAVNACALGIARFAADYYHPSNQSYHPTQLLTESLFYGSVVLPTPESPAPITDLGSDKNEENLGADSMPASKGSFERSNPFYQSIRRLWGPKPQSSTNRSNSLTSPCSSLPG